MPHGPGCSYEHVIGSSAQCQQNHHDILRLLYHVEVKHYGSACKYLSLLIYTSHPGQMCGCWPLWWPWPAWQLSMPWCCRWSWRGPCCYMIAPPPACRPPVQLLGPHSPPGLQAWPAAVLLIWQHTWARELVMSPLELPYAWPPSQMPSATTRDLSHLPLLPGAALHRTSIRGSPCCACSCSLPMLSRNIRVPTGMRPWAGQCWSGLLESLAKVAMTALTGQDRWSCLHADMKGP